MSRYFSRGTKPVRSDWLDDERPLIPTIDVPEHEAVETGLLDEHGNAIMRAPNPIGFGRSEEW